MMTTMAAMLGAVPLALGFGDGAELRQPARHLDRRRPDRQPVLTLYTTPVVYLYLDRFRLWAPPPAGRAAPPRRRKPRRAWRMRAASAVRRSPLAASPAAWSGPTTTAPRADVPTAYKELAGWSRGPAAGDAINRGAWWSIFDDPVLDALERQVDVSNQTIARRRAAYRQARALVHEARAALFPTLGANAGVTHQSSSGGSLSSGGTTGTAPPRPVTTTDYTLEGSGSWDLDVWGAIRRQVESQVAAAQVERRRPRRRRSSPRRRTLATDYFQLRDADGRGGCSTRPSRPTSARW